MVNNSKEKIINAAVKVFSEKGKHGTRMEEIAAGAGVNKALVYYYFGDRNNLYREALKTVFRALFSEIGGKLDYALSEISDPVERIRFISRAYSRLFMENQQNVRLLLEALTARTEDISGIIREVRQENIEFDPDKFAAIVKDGVERKVFREITFTHFINSFMGLQLSFHIIRSVFSAITGMEEEELQKFLHEREEIIPDILLNGILERSSRK